MDGVGALTGLTEAVSSGSAAPVQNQPEHRTRVAKCNKTVGGIVKNRKLSEQNCHCAQSASVKDECTPAMEKLADDLGVKVNLESEHCVNGLTNGISQETNKKNEFKCARSDVKLRSESSSPCECGSDVPVQDSASCEELEAVSCSNAVIETKASTDDGKKEKSEIEYVSYESELQMPDIMRIMNKDLSEPYSIYTYRYFIYNWPKLCFLVSRTSFFLRLHQVSAVRRLALLSAGYRIVEIYLTVP